MKSWAVLKINASINEIGSNSGKGRTITREAVFRAESATNKMNSMGEAARAGEAGKGFPRLLKTLMK